MIHDIAQAMKGLRKNVSDTHTAVVKLDIKLKKWAHLPEAAAGIVRDTRAKTQALEDCRR
eukprot:13773830-Alexandrium_andersonii.AAC.1